ncbi:hypothetical protein C0583_00150 [Candidatus Parcubacteria bacterium]|nr:MAG: hypothetical protein C0583_00150 [Candidatus Parcubacteria bacterium]
MLKKFSPLIWLSSLGAGGISVIFFAFLNYTIPHGKGLINISQIHSAYSGLALAGFMFLEALMVVFILLHFALTLQLIPKLLAWIKTPYYKELLDNPLANAAILAPFISITMSMNVLIGPIRYLFVPLAENLQSMMLPGFLVWSLIWIALMRMEIKLLKISFEKGFDVDKVNFGWLLHPFALGMLSVTGAGIAAMASNIVLANTAFFMLLVSGSMGLFLLLVKSVAIFKSHFASDGLPAKQFLPSLLIIVPNITLYAITFFRVGHFLEHHHGAQLGSYFFVVMTLAFAFETWYLMFGLALLKDYFTTHMKTEYHVSQWGLVCPFVAYAVLGSFVYNLFLPYTLFFWFILAVTAFTISLFFFILFKQYLCLKSAKSSANEPKLMCA